VASKTDSLAVDGDDDGVPSPGDVLGYTVVVAAGHASYVVRSPWTADLPA